ncbi:hypothetical protein V7654_08065 [Bacillus sp. JJ1609]|uniref:hypothetical protein n=1 Tax=Bacillus sp. JJ1609 TaxID=3122977 RepID=UPI002FFE065F
MSLKHFAVFLKASGLSLILVPLFMQGMGFIRILPKAGIYIMVGIGSIMLIVGMVGEVKALRAGMRTARKKAGPEK